jgi:hypothetical protein
MTLPVRQTCYHHHLREAVARCPECGEYFCRECVTEHYGRMLCSRCLSALMHAPRTGVRHWWRRLAVASQGAAGFLIIWYAFYLMGKMLLAIPHDFHEGTIWQGTWWNSP